MYLERDKKTQREREREKIKKVKKVVDARTDLASAHDVCYHHRSSKDDRDASKMLSRFKRTAKATSLFCVVSKTKKKKKKKKKKNNKNKNRERERGREKKNWTDTLN